MPQITTATETLLAKEFATVLKEWLTAAQISEVNKRNATPEYIGCCASHDFCDANMAMNEAFQKVSGREFVFYDNEKPETEIQNSKDTDLINRAWAIAKSNNFYI